MNEVSSKKRVAVIDSNPNDRKKLAGAIHGFYRISQYAEAGAALEGLRRTPPDVIVVDEMLAPGGAYDFVGMLRADRELAAIPAVVISALDLQSVRGSILRCGGNGYLPKAWTADTVLRTISNLLSKSVEKKWEALPETQRVALKGTLGAMSAVPDALQSGTPIAYGNFKESCAPLVKVLYDGDVKNVLEAVKEHDNYTFSHSFKVATLLTLFGSAIGLSENDQVLLACGGLLHDIGKMSIPFEVLNKPDRLSPEEWALMKSHVPTTMDFLTICDDIPKGARIIAAQHHEKLDGSGYPNGLKGLAINELARMAAIVDIYGALTDRRSYKEEMAPEAAFDLMTGRMSGELDTGLLNVFRHIVLDQAR